MTRKAPRRGPGPSDRILGVVAIQNNGSSPVYLEVGSEPNAPAVSAATGIPLLPGRSVVILDASSDDLWMVADANGQDVRIVEIAE